MLVKWGRALTTGLTCWWSACSHWRQIGGIVSQERNPGNNTGWSNLRTTPPTGLYELYRTRCAGAVDRGQWWCPKMQQRDLGRKEWCSMESWDVHVEISLNDWYHVVCHLLRPWLRPFWSLSPNAIGRRGWISNLERVWERLRFSRMGVLVRLLCIKHRILTCKYQPTRCHWHCHLKVCISNTIPIILGDKHGASS